MTAPGVVRGSMDTHLAVMDYRCQSCGGFGHATIALTLVLDFGWEPGPFARRVDQDTYMVDLCARCIARLAAGSDISADHVVDVTP